MKRKKKEFLCLVSACYITWQARWEVQQWQWAGPSGAGILPCCSLIPSYCANFTNMQPCPLMSLSSPHCSHGVPWTLWNECHSDPFSFTLAKNRVQFWDEKGGGADVATALRFQLHPPSPWCALIVGSFNPAKLNRLCEPDTVQLKQTIYCISHLFVDNGSLSFLHLF